MLVGCLTAVIVSVYAPWYVAVLAALVAGALLGAVMAFFHLSAEGGHHPGRLRHQHLCLRQHSLCADARHRRRQGHVDQPGLKIGTRARPLLPRCHSGCRRPPGAVFSGHSCCPGSRASWSLRCGISSTDAVGLLAARGRRISRGARGGGHSGQRRACLEPARLRRFGRARRRPARHVQLCRLHPRHDGGPRLHRSGRRAARRPPSGRRAAGGLALRHVRRAVGGHARAVQLDSGRTHPHDPVHRHRARPVLFSYRAMLALRTVAPVDK